MFEFETDIVECVKGMHKPQLWHGVNLGLTPRASKNNEPGQTIYIDHRGLISSFKRMSCEKNPPKNLRAIFPQCQHSSPTLSRPSQVFSKAGGRALHEPHSPHCCAEHIGGSAPRVWSGPRWSPVDRSKRESRFHRLAFNRSFHRQLLSAGGRTRSHSHWRAREVHVRRVDREHRRRARSESIPLRATVPVRGRDRRRRPFSARTESSRPSDVPTRRSGQLS